MHVGDGEPTSEEERWLHAAASGDRGALGLLYDRFAPAMTAVACRVLHSPRDAEDVVHDVFLEAWHRARHYDRSRGTVQTWLMMRLRSRALDRLRSAQRRSELAARAQDEQSLNPDALEQNGPHGDLTQVQGLLPRLNSDQREVLELAYFDGLSLADIARRLSLPLGTVKSRLSRAVAELRTRVHAQEQP